MTDKRLMATRGLPGMLCLLTLTACTTAPVLPPVPSVDPPPAFLTQLPEGSVRAASGQPGHWWMSLGDGQLDRLIAMALANNQDLRVGKARIDQARALAALDQSARRPSLSLNPQSRRTRASENVDAGVNIATPSGAQAPLNVTPSTYQTRWALPLEASYEPDLWARLELTARASAQRLQAHEQDQELARQSLMASVVSSYHLLGVHRSQATLLQDIRQQHESRMAALQARFDAGLGDASELAGLQIEMASNQVLLQQSQEQAELDLHVLALLCGVSPGALPSIADGDPGAQLARLPLLADLPTQVLQRRPDVSSARNRLDAALSELGAARADYFPSLKLTGSTGLESSALAQLLDPGSLIWSIAARISVPLFDGGRRDAQYAAALTRLDEAARLHEGTVMQALREVEDALVSVSARQAQVAQQQLAVKAAEQQARLAGLRADTGLAPRHNATARQAAALQQRLSLLDAQGQAFLARVSLLKVLAHP